jgi:hypothetical protein
MEFICSICEYTSLYRISIERHINKQKKCGDNPEIIEIPIEIKCEYCDKSYKTKDTLFKHLKICKVKKSDVDKEIQLLKDEIACLKKQNKQPLMGNNNVINSNNIINIQLRPYTDPRLPDDMDDIFEESWDKMKSVQTYLERIHFSEELPENNNMCITNLQTKLAKVFNGKKWETKYQGKLIDEIISNVSSTLDKWAEEDRKRHEKYKGTFIEYMEGKSKKEFDNEQKNEVKLLLYDNFKNGLVDIKSKAKQPFLE